MKTNQILSVAVGVCAWASFLPAQVADRQALHGHVPAAVTRIQPVGRLSESTNLNLAIGLPLRNQDVLQRLLQDLYDPASPRYRQYLSPEQFADQFGPTEEDYQSLAAFAQANGLTVTATHPNRVVLDVRGTVAAIEKLFRVTMRVYPHPTEGRTFYAPDVEPSIGLAVPILHVNGLDNFRRPFPKLIRKPAGQTLAKIARATGSGPNGNFLGYDFRDAYVPGTALTGAGQSVALFELDGYYAIDITNYEALARLPYASLVNVPVNGGISTPGVNGGVAEVSLDIEMVVAMAPGLSHVYVYEGEDPDSVLAKIATDNLAKQISSSWGWTPALDLTADGIFQQMAAQGQSFFNASGDSDAFPPGTADDWSPTTSTNITQVGGTTLTTSGPLGSYVSETVWNWGIEFGSAYDGVGSSGGISGHYPIPAYQQGISMVACQGSTTWRNVPDVAMTADNIYVIADNGTASGEYGGTSCAAPLWAAFTALVNQQNGGTSVGFLNPALYAIGKRADYNNCFHDITTGNNFSSSSPTNFPAVAGYDLCTGWGTPNGTKMIPALTEPLLITPAANVLFTGPVGGPFGPAAQRYSLSNSGTNALNWTLGNPAAWLTVSPASGTLAAGGSASTVTVGVASAGTGLAAGSYVANLAFTNETDNIALIRQVTLAVVTLPVFTLQPTNQAALEGATASFTVGTASNALVYYQWRQNGTNLADNSRVSGSATTNLVIANVSSTDAGAYSALASNAAGVVGSSNALLTIVPSIPVFTVQPTNQTALPGQTITLTVATIGTHPFFYRWRCNGTNLMDGANVLGSTMIGSAAASLTISNISPANAGVYSVAVSNSLGAVTNNGTAISVTSVTATGITLTRLYSFGGSDGADPYCPLAQAADGSFYGTTPAGGANGDGTVFRMRPDGSLTTLASFNNNNGAQPYAGLLLTKDGNLYGTASAGGADGMDGTIFRITTNGTLTTVASFNGANGSFSVAGLFQTADGNLYGTTYNGGAYGMGTVFRVTTNGAISTLFSFDTTRGAYPSGVLIQGADGNLYGTAENGGTYGDGTIFRVTTNGALTTVVSFNGADGADPTPGLVQDIDGSFYGTTENGGTYNYGTVFKMTSAGILTNLYSFMGGSDGAYPFNAALLLSSDGNLYGTCPSGGTYGVGTLFRITPGGAFTVLANFDDYQGMNPLGTLIQGADGCLYGTTEYGGAEYTGDNQGYGAIFQVSLPPPPLHLVAPVTIWEGTGVLTNAGLVFLAAPAASNLVVSLASGNPARLRVPQHVTVAAGSTNASFSIIVVDDTLTNGAQAVVLTATASGYLDATATVVVQDNELHHFGIAAIPSPQSAGCAFAVTVTAFNCDGLQIPTYTNTVNIWATNSVGAVPVCPSNSAAYAAGVWSGWVTVASPALGVSLCAGVGPATPGISNPFDVLASGVVLMFGLGTDPGWTRTGEWAYGVPLGRGGDELGYPDPLSGSCSVNVFGVNLDGDYATLPGGPYYLTAGPFDFHTYTNLALHFTRWLNSDSMPYVDATVEMSGDGGAQWSMVWSNGVDQITDSSWQPLQYRLAAADRCSGVCIRWGYAVRDNAFSASGWNLGEVYFTGLAGVATAPLGTPLWWLAQYGLTNSSPAVEELRDADGDGFPAWQEYLAGTDPTNPHSFFHVLDVSAVGGVPTLHFYGTTNSGVTVPFGMWRFTNMAAPGALIDGNIPRSATGTNAWTDPAPPAAGRAFYRPVATNGAASP